MLLIERAPLKPMPPTARSKREAICTDCPTRTPIPGAPPGEFTVHVDLDITGGWGKYEEAYGTIEYDGLGHSGAVPPTTDFVYKGTLCGPNIKSDGH